LPFGEDRKPLLRGQNDEIDPERTLELDRRLRQCAISGSPLGRKVIV
jgi:hypothetical protein